MMYFCLYIFVHMLMVYFCSFFFFFFYSFFFFWSIVLWILCHDIIEIGLATLYIFFILIGIFDRNLILNILVASTCITILQSQRSTNVYLHYSQFA